MVFLICYDSFLFIILVEQFVNGRNTVFLSNERKDHIKERHWDGDEDGARFSGTWSQALALIRSAIQCKLYFNWRRFNFLILNCLLLDGRPVKPHPSAVWSNEVAWYLLLPIGQQIGINWKNEPLCGIRVKVVKIYKDTYKVVTAHPVKYG